MAISSKLPSALGARPWAVRRVREAPGRQTPLPRGGGGPWRRGRLERRGRPQGEAAGGV